MDRVRQQLHEYLEVIMVHQSNEREQALIDIGKYLATMASTLPTFYHGSIVVQPLMASIDEPIVVNVPISNLVGDDWLFGDQNMWTSDEVHWQRLAKLLLTQSVPVQLNTPSQITAILRNHLVNATKMRSKNTFWVGDGHRRVYAAWLLGCTAVPLRVDSVELE